MWWSITTVLKDFDAISGASSIEKLLASTTIRSVPKEQYPRPTTPSTKISLYSSSRPRFLVQLIKLSFVVSATIFASTPRCLASAATPTHAPIESKSGLL